MTAHAQNNENRYGCIEYYLHFFPSKNNAEAKKCTCLVVVPMLHCQQVVDCSMFVCLFVCLFVCAPVLLWCPCWWLTAPCGRLKRKTALLLSSNKELLHWCFTQSNLSHSMIEILLWPAEPLFVWNLKITNWRLFELSKLKFTLLKFL